MTKEKPKKELKLFYFGSVCFRIILIITLLILAINGKTISLLVLSSFIVFGVFCHDRCTHDNVIRIKND